MSSLINKSGVRFAPKLSQRRSQAPTPIQSRKPSVTPDIKDKEEDQVSEESESEESDKEEITKRRLSVSGPLETKQRRLSTLNTTSRIGLLQKKNIINEKPFVIHHPDGNQNQKQKQKPLGKFDKPIPKAILTPPPTQEAVVLETKKDEPIKKQSPSPEQNQQEDITPPPSSSSEHDFGEKKTYLVYENECFKKVLASTEPDNLVKKNQKLKNFDELAYIPKTLNLPETQNIVLDETHFRMSDLCKPSLPIGKLSANYELAKDAKKSKRLERNEKRKLRLKAKKDRVPIETLSFVKDEPKKPIKAEDLFEQPQLLPQQQIKLKLAEDGTMVVDEESRVVDRHANIDISNLVRQDENPFENLINSSSYGKQRYNDKWDNNERILLYQGLYQWGTDFGLIAQTFPYRDRRQIKSKFLLEEKKNPHLIELTLSRKIKLSEFDLENYSKNSNKQFDELSKFNEKLKQLQKDHEKNLKELSIAKEKAKEEDLERQRKQELEVKNNWESKPKSRKERMNELTKHEVVVGSIDDVKKDNI